MNEELIITEVVPTLLTFNDFILLLIWLFSIIFAAYILSHTASFFPKFMASIARAYKNPDKYDKDYNFKFLRYKNTPSVKESKKNHGRTIFNTRKR